MPENNFASLEQSLAAGGVPALLESLASQLKAEKKYHELFEVRKMQVRAKIGLPLLYGADGDELAAAKQDELEKGLLAACREVGLLLLAAGLIREGFMYLRPVGERGLIAKELEKIEPNEENTEELLEVCLYEGIDIGRGFQLLLEKNGTCNAITTFDGLMANRPTVDQRAAAFVLLRHVYRELAESLKVDIARQQGSPAKETTVAGLIQNREWLTSGGSYHLDTTHLSAVVRMSRVLTDRESHQLALELCQYGRTLAADFQYAGYEPFVEVYPAHAFFFQALLGENTDAAEAYFKQKADTLKVEDHGTAALEAYIELLHRMGRSEAALAESIRLMPESRLSLPQAPPLLELAQEAGKFRPLIEFCRTRGDLLGFGAALAAERLGK